MQITLSWVLKPPLITRDLKSDGDDRRQDNNNFDSTSIYRVIVNWHKLLEYIAISLYHYELL